MGRAQDHIVRGMRRRVPPRAASDARVTAFGFVAMLERRGVAERLAAPKCVGFHGAPATASWLGGRRGRGCIRCERPARAHRVSAVALTFRGASRIPWSVVLATLRLLVAGFGWLARAGHAEAAQGLRLRAVERSIRATEARFRAATCWATPYNAQAVCGWDVSRSEVVNPRAAPAWPPTSPARSPGDALHEEA